MTPEQIEARLRKNISELLRAGRDTEWVSETLGRQASFGKHGWDYDRIRPVAREIVTEMNRVDRLQAAAIREQVRADVRQMFADMPEALRFMNRL
jgi:hypothetical protein